METTGNCGGCGKLYDAITFKRCTYCYARDARGVPAMFSFAGDCLTSAGITEFIASITKKAARIEAAEAKRNAAIKE